jgi:predicted nucleotidyltransferase
VILGEAVVSAVAPHPAVERIELVGSRAEGRATRWSDWDFAVWTRDFAAVAAALPELLARFEPLAQQWDRLGEEYCWMLLLAGPVKVDLIFAGRRHEKEPPWWPSRKNLDELDAHFWDWVLWLRGKEAAGKAELLEVELEKLFGHLLGPLGVERQPESLAEAVESYRAARERAEQRFGVSVRRDVEQTVAPALASAS